jgi:cytochrome oxidase Cu insertion factor (SCO1/SenC/PrrC family)
MKLLKIAAAVALSAFSISAPAAGLKVGRPAPNFELVLVDGKHVHLSDLKGQVVLLNYWAT